MTTGAIELVEHIRTLLPEHANPDRARQQQAYMKSTMPHYGLQASDLKAVLKRPLSSHRLRDRESWEHAIRSLWDEATHRELWYAAIALARHRRYREWREQVESLSLWEHMIRTGAWWDVCDEISIHLVGAVLSADRVAVTPIMRQWAEDDHLWIRRASILSQLRFKTATDTDLLTACIVPSLSGRDFFSRKAIGWALREYSKTDPVWVQAFVEQHGEDMAPLSKREALRLLPDGTPLPPPR
jgi:3-methyladenine DNA glycosylase AlkD